MMSGVMRVCVVEGRVVHGGERISSERTASLPRGRREGLVSGALRVAVADGRVGLVMRHAERGLLLHLHELFVGLVLVQAVDARHGRVGRGPRELAEVQRDVAGAGQRHTKRE